MTPVLGIIIVSYLPFIYIIRLLSFTFIFIVKLLRFLVDSPWWVTWVSSHPDFGSWQDLSLLDIDNELEKKCNQDKSTWACIQIIWTKQSLKINIILTMLRMRKLIWSYIIKQVRKEQYVLILWMYYVCEKCNMI